MDINQPNKEERRIKFGPKPPDDFYAVLKERVDQFFRKNSLPRHANGKMILKSIFFITLATALYFILLLNTFNLLGMLATAMLLGITKGMIGVNVSHDALHGSYSSNAVVNRVLGYTYDVLGLSSWVWKITHNYNHHIFTNIHGMDHDIDKAILLRFSPNDKLYPFHYYQNWYIFFLYTLTGLNWIWFSDYAFYFRESKKRLPPSDEAFLFFFFKLLNLLIFVAVPLAVIPLPWWQILIGYACMQMAGGFTVALIFQLAHLVENVDFPEPDKAGVMQNSWGLHEIATTSNFATDNPLINFFCGGLNFQIEHHLFPQVCHIHYRNISKIVRKTIEDYGLPYHENLTFSAAVLSHLRLLKKLGRVKNFK